MTKSQDNILVTLRGNDTPGITSNFTGLMAGWKGAVLLDIEQTVIHGKLLLSMLLGLEKRSVAKSYILKELLAAAKEMNLNLDYEIFENGYSEPDDSYEYVITCLGENIGAAELSMISSELAGHGINIDKIARLSHGSIRCIEMIAHSESEKNPKWISERLLPVGGSTGIDIAIQRHDLTRNAKRLVVMDMDSTLIQNEVIDELGNVCGVGVEIAKITESAMNGKTSFAESLTARVALLKGVGENVLEKVYDKLRLTDGAEDFVRVLKKLGYKTAIISGGFDYFAERMKERLGINYAFANELEITDGKLTGHIKGEIVDAHKKALILVEIANEEAISLEQTVAIGDGANDVEMLSKAGMGIAFRAKPVVREKSSYSINSHKGLDSVLYLLGISEKDVIQAMR